MERTERVNHGTPPKGEGSNDSKTSKETHGSTKVLHSILVHLHACTLQIFSQVSSMLWWVSPSFIFLIVPFALVSHINCTV